MAKVAETITILRPTTDLVELGLAELEEECAHVLHLMAQLRRLPEGEERDTLEGDLYAALVHLRMESVFTLKEWDKLVNSLPND
jgi:hypothetical protein